MESTDMREDIVYLYVNEFAYKQAKHGKLMGGHPKPGRIYRALYDKETALYRLLFDEENPGMAGLILKDLTGDCGNWTADIVKINDDTILSLDIDAEDYNKLAQWKENDKDIDSLRIEQMTDISRTEDGEVVMSIGPNPLADETSTRETVTINSLMESINYLGKNDPTLLIGLNFALQGICAFIDGKHTSVPDFARIAAMNPHIGKGVSLGLAAEAMDEYIYTNHPIAAGSLSKAVYYLLTELSRVNKD